MPATDESESSTRGVPPVAVSAEQLTLESVPVEISKVGLSLDELEAMAMENHPAIAASRARVSAARGKWVQAGLPPNPTMQYTSEEVGADSEPGLHSVMIGQTHVTANKLELRQRVIAAEIRQAQAELEATRLRVLTDVRTTFAGTLVAQQRVELMTRLRELAQQSARAVQAMLEAEELSRIELLQAQTEVEQASLAVETAQASLDGQRRRLEAFVSADSLDDRPLVGELDDVLDAISWESIHTEILETSPELAGRLSEIEQARRELTLAAAEIVPNVNVLAGAGHHTPSDNVFGAVQVTVPLPIVNRNQGRLRQARAELVEASNRLQQKERDLAERLAKNVQAYETARLQSDRIGAEIVPRAEETLRLTTDAFQAGETSYLQLLTAQRTLFEARLRELEARSNAVQSASRLEGRLLEGSLTDR